MLSLVYRRRHETFAWGLLDRLLSGSRLLIGAGLAVILSVVLVWPGLVDYAQTGHVNLHWSRAASAVFLLQLAVVAATHAVLQRIVGLWKDQLMQREALQGQR